MRVALSLDCLDPGGLALFWSAALGHRVVAETADWALLAGAGDGLPQVMLQRVPEVKATKNRMHLDLYVDDLEREIERLQSLGARPAEGGRHDRPAVRWQVLLDPEGNELCVCQRRPPEPGARPSD